MEALCSLHTEIEILHNDIKPNNVLLTDSMTGSQPDQKFIQILLIDFGKATPLQNDHKYSCSDAERQSIFTSILIYPQK